MSRCQNPMCNYPSCRCELPIASLARSADARTEPTLLQRLSETATPGRVLLNSHNRLRVLTSMDHPMCEFSSAYHRLSARGEGTDPEFMVALWNAYRDGELVERSACARSATPPSADQRTAAPTCIGEAIVDEAARALDDVAAMIMRVAGGRSGFGTDHAKIVTRGARMLERLARSTSSSATTLTEDDVVKAIDEEPELPGAMPDAMWESINGDRDAIEEAMRIAVRQTKRNIKERLRLAPRHDERARKP